MTGSLGGDETDQHLRFANMVRTAWRATGRSLSRRETDVLRGVQPSNSEECWRFRRECDEADFNVRREFGSEGARVGTRARGRAPVQVFC